MNQASVTSIIAAALTCVNVLVPSTALATQGRMDVAANTTVHLTENHFGTIVMASGARLFCDGYGVYDSVSGYNTPQCGGVQCGIRVVAADNVTVSGCDIANHTHGIVVQNSNFTTIDHSFIHQNQSTGITMDNSISSQGATGIYYNEVHHNGLEGLRLTNVQYYHIQDNWTYSNGRDGFDVSSAAPLRCDGNLFEYNWSHDNGVNGLELDNCFLNTVRSNIFENNGANMQGHGISLGASSHMTIDGNTVIGNAEHGIRVTDECMECDNAANAWNNGNTIANNTVSFNRENGIHVSEGNNNTLRFNTVFSNGKAGIKVTEEGMPDDSVSTGNVITDNTSDSNGTAHQGDGHGIWVKDTKTSTISRNKVRSNWNDGLRLTNFDSGTITSNVGSGNGDGSNNCSMTRGSDYHTGNQSNGNNISGNSFVRNCYNVP